MITDGLQPSYLNEALDRLAKHMGKDACRDRAELLCLINEFREMLYIDDRFPRMFDEIWHCIKLSCYPLECYNSCVCKDRTFKGFVMPDGCESLEQAFTDNEPLRIHSTWWEARTYRRSSKDVTNAIVPTDMVFPTQRALREPGDIIFQTSVPENTGKRVLFTYINGLCDEEKICVVLDHKMPQVVNDVYGIVDVQLPDKLEGEAEIHESDGYALAQYNQYTKVPRYRLFKVLTGHCKDQVLIKCKREFKDICWDSDIVEVGSNIILKEFGKYIKYGDDSLEASERSKANESKSEMYRLVNSAYMNKYGQQKEDAIATMKGFNAIPDSMRLV